MIARMQGYFSEAHNSPNKRHGGILPPVLMPMSHAKTVVAICPLRNDDTHDNLDAHECLAVFIHVDSEQSGLSVTCHSPNYPDNDVTLPGGPWSG